MKKKICVLYSGGLDSMIMSHMAKIQNPQANILYISYDHGQPVAEKEIANLPSFVQVRKIEWMNDKNQPIMQPGRREGAIMIPGRNLVFATLLAATELPDEIWIGALHGETHEKGTDKNYTFLEHLNRTINYVVGPFRNHNPIVAKFPLADAKLDKLGEVKWALANGLTKENLLSTRSCHAGDTDRCGQCIQCFKRWCVFGECGFSETYDVPPLHTDFGKQFVYDIVNCALGNDNYYGEETRAELMPWLLQVYYEASEVYEERTLKLFIEYDESLAKVSKVC